ncbi:MAG: hypothetical protein E6J01_13815 [Chloroflexi bacterium]|nr:MAG: hypothetical protein E6J01_13815 [Chloroflexota bacterium]
MTRQVGEFSALLGDLLPVPDDLLCGALRDLQREVEASPVSRLHVLARRAISLTDVVCWVTLERGNMMRFCRDVDTAVALRQFTVSAKLLPELEPSLSGPPDHIAPQWK